MVEKGMKVYEKSRQGEGGREERAKEKGKNEGLERGEGERNRGGQSKRGRERANKRHRKRERHALGQRDLRKHKEKDWVIEAERETEANKGWKRIRERERK